MKAFITVIIVFAMLGAVGALALGIVGLFRNADSARSNRLMQYRVLFQAIAVVLIGALAYMTRH
jgi:NADH:ubiquinone oxidoreductase subunit 6 (subunit J)